MNVAVAGLAGGQKKITIEVSVADTEPFLVRAVGRLSAKHQIPGFRPGHAPAEVIRSRFGEGALLEEALNEIISKTLFDALRERSIDSVGEPSIAIEKMAPGNPLVYAATVSVMPKAALGEWRSLSVKKNEISISDADVNTLIDELREMSTTETLALRPAAPGDKVEINFEIRDNGVVIEGGSGKKFPVVLGKGALIPGFETALAGMSTGEKKTFPLTFPTPYFQAHLAGKPVEVSVELLAVYARVLPEPSDAWAQKMMNKTLVDLRAFLKENVRHEREHKERGRLEHTVVEGIVGRSTFGEIPEILVKHEIEKMIAELEDDVRNRGMQWQKYLESIKKSVDDLRVEFQKPALERVRAALVMRELARELSVAASDDEVRAEWERHKEQYKDNKEAAEAVVRHEYRDYLARVLTNRKVLDTVVSLIAK